MAGVPVSFKYERTVLTCFMYEHPCICSIYIIVVRVSFKYEHTVLPCFKYEIPVSIASSMSRGIIG